MYSHQPMHKANGAPPALLASRLKCSMVASARRRRSAAKRERSAPVALALSSAPPGPSSSSAWADCHRHVAYSAVRLLHKEAGRWVVGGNEAGVNQHSSPPSPHLCRSG